MTPGIILLWLWLAAGLVVFLHGLVTGGGLAGLWLYHDLVTSHKISPDFAHEAVFVGLCVPPLALLAWHYRRPRTRQAPDAAFPAAAVRRAGRIFVAAGIAIGVTAGALWASLDGSVKPGAPAGSVSSQELGARPSYVLKYEVANYTKTRTYRHEHSLWTVTVDGQVHAVIDVREVDRFPGALLPAGSLPTYAVWVLRDRGLRVPDDVAMFVPAGKPTPIRVYVMVTGVALTLGSLIIGAVLMLAARFAPR